jgi:hypothetical protein
MEGHLMTTVSLALRMHVAWWVRPALAVVFVCASLCPARADQMIDAIVDRGIKIELT